MAGEERPWNLWWGVDKPRQIKLFKRSHPATERQREIVTGATPHLTLKRRVRDWLATSLLGLLTVLLLAVPYGLLLALAAGLNYLINPGLQWTQEKLEHPRPQPTMDHFVPYVVLGTFALLGLWLVLALLRAIPRLVMIWVLLRTTAYEGQPSTATHRLRQFLVVPKGFGLMFASVLLGAIVGLSVTNAPEATGLLHMVMLLLESIFLGLMFFVGLFMALRIQRDLDKMSPTERMVASRDFLQKWSDACPHTNRFLRFLRPPRWVRHLIWNFAQKPKVFSELLVPTLTTAALIGYVVWRDLSPMF
ncbi:putative membrane protein YqgA involved in biofilm formation [Mycobacteroides chelonae]|nr:putative membrane protein YqgA involved in biofilm formation [Mycobacteroides chelonae]